MKTMLWALLLIVFCDIALAQTDTVDNAARDSVVQAPVAAENTPRGESSASDSLSIPRRQTHSPQHVVFSRDSLKLMEYHHAGALVAGVAGVSEYSLGNLGQPLWLGIGGSSPMQWSMALNGGETSDPLTMRSNPFAIATEDMSEVRIYPQYESFWVGGAGSLLAVDFVEKEWDAPRPITRLRHTEAANEYLYTDAMFTLNPSESENLFLAGTRTTIGATSTNGAARFANNLHEGWNLRLRYRKDFSEHVRARAALRYDDDITLLNGGVANSQDGEFSRLPYPLDGAEPFSTEAFDPKSALLVNSTMFEQKQRYTAEVSGNIQWDRDSAHVTLLRVTAQSEVRRFRDKLQDLYVDSLAEGYLNLTDRWSRVSFEVQQVNDLEWATLTLGGTATPYIVEKGEYAFYRSGLNTMLRGKLDLTLGFLHAAGMARLDRAYDRSAFSAGVGGDIRLHSALSLWAGLSYTPRIYSLTEQLYRRYTIGSGSIADTPLEESRIAEFGLRADLDWFQADLRLFQRQSERRLTLVTDPVIDTLYGRYTLHINEGGATDRFTGASADVRIRYWRIHLDQKFSSLFVRRKSGWAPTLLAPDLSYKAELYYRGSLIEGTLDLKLGGAFSYNNAYLPTTYHPVTGLFTYAMPGGAWSFTDMWRVDAFLFATIKDRATIHLVLHNALDTPYISTQFYPMFDRALRLGVNWVFFD